MKRTGRILNLVLLAAMIVGAVWTYNMKHRAEKAADKVAELQADIDREKAEIALLKAEYSMLMQPARIQSVVDQFPERFGLVPFSPDQIGLIDDIPLRPPSSDADARETLERLAVGNLDPIETGGVRP